MLFVNGFVVGCVFSVGLLFVVRYEFFHFPHFMDSPRSVPSRFVPLKKKRRVKDNVIKVFPYYDSNRPLVFGEPLCYHSAAKWFPKSPKFSEHVDVNKFSVDFLYCSVNKKWYAVAIPFDLQIKSSVHFLCHLCFRPISGTDLYGRAPFPLELLKRI